MPLKTGLKRDLEITIETSIMLNPETTIRELAQKIYNSEPELMEQAKEPLLMVEEQKRTRARVTVADVIAAEKKKQDWKI